MEILLSFLLIPVMIVMSIGIAMFLMRGLFWIFERTDSWNRGDFC